jgi:hypothetical protein
VFCCAFFMLFLAATNDRNHTVSPPNNIKLRPHSILYYFVYFASYFVSVYGVLWPMMNNLINNMFVMLLIKPWDTSIPILWNMGWMSPTVPWLTWTCKLFWSLLVLMMILYDSCLWWSCMPHATHQNMRDIHAHVFPILGWMSRMLPWLPWLMLIQLLYLRQSLCQAFI